MCDAYHRLFRCSGGGTQPLILCHCYIQVSCSEGQRGIYLREPHQLSKPVTKSVSVTTHYDDDVGEFLRMFCFFVWFVTIERFHSRGQHLCKFIATKESVCIRKESNSHRTGLEQQHGHRFIVLEHQYGRRDVMWKHSIDSIHRQHYSEG